jgi:hypothetical protein
MVFDAHTGISYFLCVPTNVNYINVATFVTETEDSSSLIEALQVIKEWNPDWSPKYFMCDYANGNDGQYLCCNIKLYIFSMNTLEELQNVGQKSETSQANLKTCVNKTKL